MHNEKISYFKRTLVMLMAVMLVFTYMPTMAWADPSGESTDADAVAIAAVTLSGDTADLVIGDTATMTAPEAGEGEIVTWTSSDSDVATVENGTVTAVAVGTATITATVKKNKSETCTVTVWGTCGAATNKDGERSVQWTLGSNGTLTVKGTGAMTDYDGTSQPWKANKEKIEKVVVEEGVTTIGNYAFYQCTNLDKIEFATTITSIGQSAFGKAKLSQELVVPGTIKSLGASAFAECTELTNITLAAGEGISYGNFLFSKCKKLKTVSLPDTMTSIPNGMFQYCSSIDGLVIPNNISAFGAIGISPIQGMTSLKKITIPAGIKTTYMKFFSSCTSLRKIEFEGVTKIEANTFLQCTGVRELILPATLEKYSDTTAQMLPKLICFRGTEEQWKKAVPEVRRTAWADAGTVVVCNYNENDEGTPATITSQPKSAVFAKGSEVQDLTVSVAADADMQFIYSWYMDDGSGYKFVESKKDNPAAITPEYSKAGTYRYYCEIKSVKNNKVASVTSDVATITVTEAEIPFDKSTTEENTYFIKTASDFDALSRLVKGGYAFSGITFKMTADITLSDDWTPIGTTKDGTGTVKGTGNLLPFSGTIDGDGHLLTVPEGGKPLLAYILDANVKNLNIYGKQINGYGLVDEYKGVGIGVSDKVNAITIDNVTIKAGTNILKSGFLGTAIDYNVNGFAGCSNGFEVTIKNCKIEKGVTIGSDGTQSEIGGFAGRIQGTISNCVSEATVKGENYVGGILGTRDNAMGLCKVENCTFKGEVIGSGDYIGGIVGGGYNNSSAPNGIHIDITNCRSEGDVTGRNNVGGILGGDGYIAQGWSTYSLVGNSFSGKISGKTNVGGIIGYCRSLNKSDNIAGNYYTKNCGVSKGIGLAELVDTNKYANLTVKNGTTYINTSNAKVEAKSDSTMGENTLYLNTAAGYVEGPSVTGCNWKLNYNRTDDPLCEDADKLAKAVDTIPTEAFCYELIADKEYVETYVGDELDISKLGVTFTAKWTNNKADTTVDAKDGKVTGYNKNSHSVQTVTLTYGYAVTTIQVAVKQKESSSDTTKNTLTVNFKLLGDSKHDSDTDKKVHGLATGGLTTWTSGTYTVPLNSTVWDLMQTVAGKNSNVTFNAKGTQYGTYIYSVIYNGTELGEFDNGKNSGWMYTVNGTHPEVAVGARFLNDGDTVVFHYTDDYTKEEGSEKWNSGTKTEETKTVTTDTTSGSIATTAPTETKVTEKTTADGTKEKTATVTVSADNQTEIIKQATDKKSTEIVLEVASTATSGAQNVQLQLNVSFVKNVSEKTDAALTVNTENGTVSLDQDTIKTVLDEAKGATITLDVNKVANPTEVQKKAAGTNGQILSLTVKSGDKTISDFKTGKVTVTVAISTALQNKRVAAIHIAEDGKIQQMPGKSREVNGKKCFEFTTSHFSDFALVDADELGLETEDEIDAAALAAKLTPVARSAKTAKGYIKVTTSLDKSDKAIISDLKDAGYTIKYRFYRSTKKAANYKSAITKKTTSYTNTTGKKGTKYFYKVQVRVYDESGKLVARTALKQCRYASRKF